MSPSEVLADTEQQAAVLTWTEPDGIAVRGTLVVIPGRGEQPGHYERFGRRISVDGYRVHAVSDPTADAGLALAQITGLLACPGTPGPRVLVGSDTGALFAAGLAASGQAPGLDALILAGLPAAARARPRTRGTRRMAPRPARGTRNSTSVPRALLIARGCPARAFAAARCTSRSLTTGRSGLTWAR